MRRVAILLFVLPLAAAPVASARPAAVGSLQARAGVGSVQLTWRDADRRDRFEVRWRRPGRRWRVLGVGRRRSVTVARLAPSTRYSFGVRACRLRACSVWSRTRSVRTRAGRPTPAPPNSHPLGTGTGGCPVFPADNPWHRDVSGDPVDSNSAAYIASIGAAAHLHPDFGSTLAYGIPYVVVGSDQPPVPIHFTDYGDESDPGPYPVPPGAPVEGFGEGGDRHVLVLQSGICRLYELYAASINPDLSWNAGSGAVFDLRSNALRHEGWTSADAAGLPIFPGLIRYDEVQSGVIDHAIRFTVARSQRGYIHPATHSASDSSDPALPPMGLRVRLKAGFDISGYNRTARVILTAMKRYGMIVADNGSNWFFGGATDPRWDDDQLNALKDVPGSAFEVVRSGPIVRG